MLPAIRGQVGAGETLRFGLGLDGIQQANASQRLMRPGWVALLRLEKTATGVCPTAYMGCSCRVERVVARVGIGVNEAAVAGQELLGELLLAAGAEVEDCVRVALVADIDPGIGRAPWVE